VVKKEVARIATSAIFDQMLPENYQNHLVTQANKAQYLILSILVQLLPKLPMGQPRRISKQIPFPHFVGKSPQEITKIFGLTQPNNRSYLAADYLKLYQGKLSSKCDLIYSHR
jgi:hypothetical protein